MARKRKHRRARPSLELGLGPDVSGNFGVNPYTARGHIVESAPQELRTSKDSSYPKRIATQRMFDRYFRWGHIEHREWKAADNLWRLWCTAGLEASTVANYTGVGGTGSRAAPFEKNAMAGMEYLNAVGAIPYRSRGVVAHVVVRDLPAADWAKTRGYRGRDSERLGLIRLSVGLSALAAFFGY